MFIQMVSTMLGVGLEAREPSIATMHSPCPKEKSSAIIRCASARALVHANPCALVPDPLKIER